MFGIEPTSEMEVYAAVGRALSRWEMLEVNLADLYATFKGRPGSTSLIQEMCDGARIFKQRLNALEEAATGFFITHCDQALEGETADIIKGADALSINRNRIAHGLVQFAQFEDVGPDGSIEIMSGYFLAPPWYAMKRLRLNASSGATAGFIDEMSDEFNSVRLRASKVANALLRPPFAKITS